ncbi:SMI1/KNR4 family protein [Enterobacter sichuanensis]|uniref:SMI1/KNR4 family protein n=1 Tax=Enterobacter sichuanensis TaxID=2071710 RepID=UPI00159627CC|nr:SMI1/KNR4 family protein [Enterobacter sichuanensis]
MMIKFVDSSPAISVDELDKIEALLGISFPRALKTLWLISNGGIMEEGRRVYQSEHYENDIKYFLPILHTKRSGILTVDDYYKDLVVNKKILAENFIPFAIDGGGFPYCVGINDGAVYFCDLENQEEIYLEPNFEIFIGKIIPQDEAW